MNGWLNVNTGLELNQSIGGEQCAISVYEKLMELTMTGDPVTYSIALQILPEEVEHEEDLQSSLEDHTLTRSLR